jgi:hypothetical protein
MSCLAVPSINSIDHYENNIDGSHSMDSIDLDTLEARGASFAKARAGPRHRPSSSTTTHVKPSPRTRSRHHSQLSGVSAFGISAYGFILIATAFALATLFAVLVYAASYLFST